CLAPGEANLRPERNAGDRQPPCLVFGEHPLGFIVIRLNNEAGEARTPQKGQHVAAGAACDERLLRIDGGRIRIGNLDHIGRRRSGNGESTVERPTMSARIFLAGEVAASQFPCYPGLVMRHESLPYRAAITTAALPIATALVRLAIRMARTLLMNCRALRAAAT